MRFRSDLELEEIITTCPAPGETIRLLYAGNLGAGRWESLALGKCIFAVGTPDVASIRHLLDNDAAIVASNHKDVYAHLKKILDEPEMIPYYGKQAYACGAKCHNKATMQTMLMEDLRKVVEKNA